MKKSLLILALAMFSFASAQKGTVLVLGNVSFWSNTESNRGGESNSENFNFSPKVGYQFKDNWTVGIETGFSTSKNKYTSQENEPNSQQVISRNFSAGAFVRYSKSLSQMFLLYADLGAGYETKTNSFSNLGSSKTTFDGFYTSFTPGLFLNIKNNFGLNFGIGGLTYSNTKDDRNNVSKSNIYFNFGQSFNIGISKNF